MNRTAHVALHAAILSFAFLTLLPFLFVINNSFRTNSEITREFFGLPQNMVQAARMAWLSVTGPGDAVQVEDTEGTPIAMAPREAFGHYAAQGTRGYRFAWEVVRPYMFNTLLVCLLTAVGVIAVGSTSAYVLSRHRFLGSRAVFLLIISTMMFPAVLTLVPSFLLVRQLGLLNSYWVLVLPYVAGGQVFAIYVFKSFFDGLPEDLFDAARIDGAGHFQTYWNVVVPLSKPVIGVVLIMTVLGTWNNFLWPFITNTESQYHVITSGLFIVASSGRSANYSMLYASYVISSIPLIILFAYATKSFLQGVTAGAFKA